jgi:hypothetical protein
MLEIESKSKEFLQKQTEMMLPEIPGINWNDMK